ncbi:hypothetical protein [Streptomyces sp. CoH17]|uniref:hypothetical protein n=1 Tax=Streptomyces sp. CoH17 TaxID=2992806 RepID=UPI002270E899|nr:hypothetical protein [Streptomyces sp. CoH17]
MSAVRMGKSELAAKVVTGEVQPLIFISESTVREELRRLAEGLVEKSVVPTYKETVEKMNSELGIGVSERMMYQELIKALEFQTAKIRLEYAEKLRDF